MMQPQILYVISGDIFAGKEMQLLNLISEFDNIGISTAVIIFNTGVLFEKLRLTKTKLFLVEEKKGFFNLLFSIKKIIKQFKPEVVVTEDYKEAVVAFFSLLGQSRKLILHFHGNQELRRGWKGLKIKSYYFIYKFVAKYCANALIFPCQDLARELSLNINKAKIIYNSFSVSNESLEESNIIVSKPAILCIGRLVPVKRFDHAIKSFMLFLDTFQSENSATPKLYFLGEGEEFAALDKLTSDLNLKENIEFLGFKRNILQYLSQANLLLLTSEHEGVPTVILEAISKGIPIVCTKVGGIPEVMQYFKGYNFRLVDKANINEMALAIKEVLSNKMTEDIINENLKVLYNNFSAKVIADRHLQFYKSILN